MTDGFCKFPCTVECVGHLFELTLVRFFACSRGFGGKSYSISFTETVLVVDEPCGTAKE